MIQDLYSLAREIKENYENDKVDTVEGLSIDTYEIIREAEFMSSGHYMSGDNDEDGNIKPYRDVITRILENQRSAEEIDTKDAEIKTDEPELYVRGMLLSKFNQDWMEENNIAQLHNEAIETRGKTGGLLLKVIEGEDNVYIDLVDWNSFSGDAADLPAGMKVIPHFYTPADLIREAQENGWDMEAVDEAIALYAEADQDEDMKIQRETTGKYILVREVSGVMSRQYMDDDADEHDYSFQVHYIAGSEFTGGDGKERGVTLSSTEHDDNIFYYLPYKKRTLSGKTLGIGMVERSRHAQIASNKGAQNYDKAMDLASTHILQSASKNLKGKNVLKNMKSGTILKTDDGKPISAVDMSPQALAHFNSYMMDWQNVLDRATNTYAIATGNGEDLPADMTYRLGAVLDQNAQSPFDLRREEYSIFWNRIYKEKIIPFFIRQMKNKKELKLKFSPEELKKLDRDKSLYEANSTVMEKYMKGEYDSVPPVMKFAVMETEVQTIMETVQEGLKKGKNRRTITDFPEGYWDVENKFYIDMVGERSNKNAVLGSVDTVLMRYMQLKPQLDADPQARKLFNQIVETAGLEPIDFNESTPTQPQQPPQGQQPQKGQTGLDNPEQLRSKPQ